MNRKTRLRLALPILFGAVLFIASCAQPTANPEPAADGPFRYGSVQVTQHCDRVYEPDELVRMDPLDFAIDSGANQYHELFSGTDGAGRSFVLSSLGSAPECKQYTTITIIAGAGDNVEVLPVPDWPEVAGSGALEALEGYREECESLSYEERWRRFGPATGRDTAGRVFVISDFSDCSLGTVARVYSIRFRGQGSDLVVSNVNGEVFVEDLSSR